LGVPTCASTFLNTARWGLPPPTAHGGCARAKERKREKGTRRGLQERGDIVAWQRRDALDAN
jgi:hypothetical protein